MQIRPAQQSDLEPIAALHAESWRDAYSDVLPKQYLADQLGADLLHHWRTAEIRSSDVLLVAEDHGIIGFIAVWCRPEPFIDNLHVKPANRSERVGSSLMKSAAKTLIQSGHKTAHLWVVESNQRAIHFYERLGGVCTDRELKKLFGHMVPNVKVVWSDIYSILI